MAELQLEIEGMRCASCVQTIEGALAKEPGVAKASVNLTLARGRVEFDAAKTGAERIVAAVKEAGFVARAAAELDVARALEEDVTAARSERIQLAIAAAAALPLLVIEHGLGGAHGRAALLAEGVAATLAVLVGGWPFFAGAARTLARAGANMDVLVALGAGAALAWSWLAVLKPELHVGHHLSFAEAAILIVFVRGGKMLEGRARLRAREALRALVAREPRMALVRSGSETRSVPVAKLAPGDEIVVRAGETVPADGTIIEGASSFAESVLTRETIPVDPGAGAEAAGGSVNVARVVVIRATRTGEETALRRVARLVLEAQAQKAPIQRFADRAARVFVPSVLVLAVATFAGWWLAEAPFAVALARAVAVLIIACPCALGLATPAAILVGSGVGLRHGILVRGAPALESLGRVATVILDKTGTLTAGRPSVVARRGSEEAIAWAAALEARSTHPLARAIAALAPEGSAPSISGQEEIAGFGVRGQVAGKEVLVGRADLLAEKNVKRDDALAQGLPEGATRVHVAVEGVEVAVIALRDEPRPEAREAVERLKALGVVPAIFSGDRADAVSAVARALGIEDAQGELSPRDKLGAITRRVSTAPDGQLVAMVGDGINDAPALARADVGIALGTGTDVAKEAGTVVLTRDDLLGVPAALELGRATLAKIRQNLFLAVVYNVVAIPLAAGLLSRWGVELTPAFAGLAMALSSASVVGNALLLGRWRPRARVG